MVCPRICAYVICIFFLWLHVLVFVFYYSLMMFSTRVACVMHELFIKHTHLYPLSYLYFVLYTIIHEHTYIHTFLGFTWSSRRREWKSRVERKRRLKCNINVITNTVCNLNLTHSYKHIKSKLQTHFWPYNQSECTKCCCQQQIFMF